MSARQRQALAVHDNVVQRLATAKLSLEVGETAAGMAALEAALVAARHLVSDLLGDPELVDVRPGDLRRDGTAARPSPNV